MFIIDDIIIGTAATVLASAGTAGAAALGAVTAAGSTAAGALVAAGSAAAGAAGSVGAAIAATGTAAAGTAISVGGTVVGAVTSTGGVVLGVGTTAAGTVTGTIDAALSAAAEMAAAAAAESTAIVSQIPVVGEGLAGAIQSVGTAAGQVTTKAATSVGLSNQTAKTLGNIAYATTTNEINNQVLKPYNEIKDNITGLSEIKKNVKVLDDLYHGRISYDDMVEIVTKHKEEITDYVIKESGLDKYREDIAFIRNIKDGSYTYEELADYIIDKAQSEDLNDARNLYKLASGLKDRDITFESAADILLEKLELPKAGDKDKIRDIIMGKGDKNDLQNLLLEVLEAPDIRELESDINILRRIAEGKVTDTEIKEFILGNIEKPLFKDVKGNTELMNDIYNDRLSIEGLSAVVAQSMGVMYNENDIDEDSIRMRCNKDLLSVLISARQKGSFFDISFKRQYIDSYREIENTIFFPHKLLSMDEDGMILEQFSLQNIGEPVIYPVVNALIANEVDFEITEARRDIIINDIGNNYITILDLYSMINGVSREQAYSISNHLPFTFAKGVTVEEAAGILKMFDDFNVKYSVVKNAGTLEKNLSLYLRDSGTNQREIISLLRKIGYTVDEAIEIIESTKDVNRKVLIDLDFDSAIKWAKAFYGIGAVAFISKDNCADVIYESIYDAFKDKHGIDLYSSALRLGCGFGGHMRLEDLEAFSIEAKIKNNRILFPLYGRLDAIYTDNWKHGFIKAGAIICDVENSGNIYHVIAPCDANVTFSAELFNIVYEDDVLCTFTEADADEVDAIDSIYAGFNNGRLYVPLEGVVIDFYVKEGSYVRKGDALCTIRCRDKLIDVVSPYDVEIMGESERLLEAYPWFNGFDDLYYVR